MGTNYEVSRFRNTCLIDVCILCHRYAGETKRAALHVRLFLFIFFLSHALTEVKEIRFTA